MVSTKLILSGLAILTAGSGALITKSFFLEKTKTINKKRRDPSTPRRERRPKITNTTDRSEKTSLEK